MEKLQVRLTEKDFDGLEESYLEALLPACDATPEGLVFCEISVDTLLAQVEA